MEVTRSLEAKIKSSLFQDKILILYGPRQAGKTTLVNRLLARHPNSIYLNCDEPATQKLIQQSENLPDLKRLLGSSSLIAIDEAQRVPDIGLKLKLLADNFPGQQIIATGSSSFELANRVVEPLTGRNIQFYLYPFSLPEIIPNLNPLDYERQIDHLLIYGSYPAVYQAPSLPQKQVELKRLVSDYLYKDILEYDRIKSSETIKNLLAALALQIGQEVSYTEVAGLIKSNPHTVESYLDILEKAFVVFRLRPLSRNLRKEIGKSRKVYFFDTGLRNALINNFNPLSLRQDTGALWENFVVSEFQKLQYSPDVSNPAYFWRTYDQQEVDYIEDKGGRLSAYEIKWQKTKKNAPVAFRSAYPNSVWTPITRSTLLPTLTSMLNYR